MAVFYPKVFATIKHINAAGPQVKVELITEWGAPIQVEKSQERFHALALKKATVIFVSPKEIRVFAEQRQRLQLAERADKQFEAITGTVSCLSLPSPQYVQLDSYQYHTRQWNFLLEALPYNVLGFYADIVPVDAIFYLSYEVIIGHIEQFYIVSINFGIFIEGFLHQHY